MYVHFLLMFDKSINKNGSKVYSIAMGCSNYINLTNDMSDMILKEFLAKKFIVEFFNKEL